MNKKTRMMNPALWALALVLMLLLAVALLAVPARADDAVVYVRGYNGELKLEDGKHYGVTSSGNYEMYFKVTESANYISWNQDTNTLTLNNTYCTGRFGTFPVIRAVGDLNINLTGGMSRITPSTAAGCILVTGNLTVTAQDASSFLEVSGGDYAIQADSISAPGLTIRAGADSSSAKIVPAYHAEKYVSFTKPETAYPLWIGGLQVTSDWLSYNSAYLTDADTQQYGSGKWAFTPEHNDIPNTLTLDNYSYTGGGYNSAAMYYGGEKDLIIDLVGNNSLTHSGGWSESFGFATKYGDYGVTFQSKDGMGSLTAQSGDTFDNLSKSSGLYISNFRLEINQCSVTVGSGNASVSQGIYASSIVVHNNAVLTATCDKQSSNGIEAHWLSVADTSRVNASGEQYGVWITGALSKLKITDNAALTAQGNQAIKTGDNTEISIDGMTVRAGTDANNTVVVTGDGWKTQKYVSIFKPYPLWVGGTQVTSLNKDDIPAATGETRTGKASYHPSTNTLTLDAYTYSGEGCYFTDEDAGCAAALYYCGTDELVVEFKGECSLTQAYDTAQDTAPNFSGGMYFEDSCPSVVIRPATDALDGTKLTISGGPATYLSGGICCDTNLTLSGTIEARGADQTESHSFGIFIGPDSGSLTANDCTLTAVGGTVAGYELASVGVRILSGYLTAADTTLTATGGAVTGTYCLSSGIYMSFNDLTATGCTLTATGGAVTGGSCESDGISIYFGDLTATDTSVIATGGTVTGTNGESFGINVDGAVAATGNAAVTANGGKVTDQDGVEANEYGRSFGLDCVELSVSGGAKIVATADDAPTVSHGIDCAEIHLAGADVVVTGQSGEAAAAKAGISTDPDDYIDGSVGVWVWESDSSEFDNALAVYYGESDPLRDTPAEYFEKLDAAAENGTAIPYVRFSQKQGIIVTFDGNGGEFADGNTKQKKTASQGDYVYAIAADVTSPTRSGYTFNGWSLTSRGAAIEKGVQITDDTIVYALWTAQGGSYYVGDSRPAAPKAADGTTNGKLTFDPANPKSGDTVTVTVTPDDGYELDSITAKDANGRDVTLTKNDDGTYSFTQGSSQVTVTVTFKEKKTETLDPLAAFSDLDPKAWYADDVRWALTEGIMNGMGGGIFAPDGKVSRAMVMQVLWKMEGCPVVNYAMTFSDVDQEEWYAEAVRWAASMGLTNGYEDGSCRPDDAVTREELATFLYRYMQSKGKGFTGAWMFPLEFDDASVISEWADEAMHWMVMNGILNGRGENLLVPDGTATRAELAAILHRLDALLAA